MNKTSYLLLILEYSVMTSNGLAEISNHIQYNPTTYAKGKYAYVFQGQQNGFQSGWGQGTVESNAGHHGCPTRKNCEF